MNSLKVAWRKLFRKGEHSLTRIISLSAGLAFGILLLSEVFYYYSYDSFYPDANRVYLVCENFKTDKSSAEIKTYKHVSGAIAPGLKAEVPGIEAASRLNSIGPSVFYTDDRKSYKAEFSLTDENLFDVLPRPVLDGNPKEILKTPMNCMISDEIAGMIGGNVVGRLIELKEFPGKTLTIAGIFKALPENTNYRYDVLVSMVSTSSFTWDGTNNWLGNDRYYACVKLEPGVDPENLAPAVRKMQEVHQDIVRLESIQNGMVLKYSFKQLKQIHVEESKDMIVILTAIAFAVLLVSLLNYLLLTLSSMVSRVRNSAVYKTCGARTIDLQKMIFIETLVIFLISLAGAYLILTSVQPLIETQLGHRLTSALSPHVIRPLVIILVVILLFISYLPGRFFARTPVITVFQEYHQKGKRWKLALLAVQFSGTTFILTMLLIVVLQYDKLMNADHGYQAENVYFASTSGMPGSKLSTVVNELRALPQVETVGIGLCIPTEGASGNNILLPGAEKELFNVADFYWIDENYFEILNIPVTEGVGFSQECVPNDFLISSKGAEKLLINTGWNDGVIGKQIKLTEHGTFTIRGVFPDFIIRSIADADPRPAIFSYMPAGRFQERIESNPSFSCFIMVKAKDGAGPDIVKHITDIVNLALPYRDALVRSLNGEKTLLYQSQEGFRTAMLTGSIIILIITLLGLLGYTITEVSRRSKELALRKINGARLSDILVIFVKDLVYIAIPAILAGLTGAWFGAQKWMENFVVKTPLQPGIFILCGLFVLVLIFMISSFNYIIISNRNPAEALRYE